MAGDGVPGLSVCTANVARGRRGSVVVIRVASVPASHVYVRHLACPEGDDVIRLTDPVPADGRKVPGAGGRR